MHIGIAGPISTSSIAHLLDDWSSSLPPGYGGAPFMAILIEELLRKGHTVSAFTTSLEVPPSPHEWRIAGSGNFKIHYCGQRPSGFRPTGGYLGKALDAFRIERAALIAAMQFAAPDVVHAHWSYEFGLAALASSLPAVVTCHDAPGAVLRSMPNAYRLIRYFMARACIARATSLTAVSPFVRDQVLAWTANPASVIPNPLASQILDRGRARDFSGASDRRALSVAMVMNGWNRLKNPIPAIQAIQRLRRTKHPGLEVHLFGTDYEPGGPAQRWATSQGVADGLRFHGATPHNALLARLVEQDILLHPSLTEGCPMGIAEAMALGVPTVGGAHSGGVPWVVGDAGILTDITSPDDIAHALDTVLTQPRLHCALAHKARLRAQELFSPGRVAALYEREYRTVLGEGK